MPRSIDVIVKHFAVDCIKPGDKIILTGNLIVVPEASKLIKPGLKVFTEKQNMATRNDNVNKVKGLKDLGVRELSYKLALVTQSIEKYQTLHIPRTLHTNVSVDQNLFENLSEHQKRVFEHVKNLVSSDKVFSELSNFIAPHI